MAYFGAACASCPLLAHRTTSKNGRTITVGPYERQLAAARACQADPAWQADYKATRPIVERKQAHMNAPPPRRPPRPRPRARRRKSLPITDF